ncbi:hypothetical protein P170DRAFT_513438 [Aspergillus steynii IBT 23096]|uniref:Zn(2)-C6 fungal-type domain-containing protein n=1 Tax=Aspergillus steynii IBT 23096 TaxID=1392250 RepID=A0A2I2FU90_9EURO|nr:uncharacterized protein P170DRAFT_513438 [Aspergillus steynii IBT 23096]PLB44213.1 hypothetical protein P170DRAFT_513438 [Aspergillus steynii IBT 23096]
METASSQYTGGRPHKSRRSRPCDLCRARKAACVIATKPPCELCRVKGRPCTFVNGPGSRRRPLPPSQPYSDNEAVQPESEDCGIQNPTDTGSLLTFSFPEFGLPEGSHTQQQPSLFDTSMEDFLIPFDCTQHIQLGVEHRNQPEAPRETSEIITHCLPEQSMPHVRATDSPVSTSRQPSLDEAAHRSNTITLDQQTGKSYRFVGPLGELDSHLIARRRFNQDLQSVSPYTSILYQQTRPTGAGDSVFQPPPVFIVGETSRLESSEPKLDCGSLIELRQKFNILVRPSFARESIRVYFEFIHPSFPIISQEQIPSTDEKVESIPLSFLAAICASSVSFLLYDNALSLEASEAPSATQLVRISWTALQLELPDVRLCTVQTCLLILQCQSREDFFGETPFNWQLCAMMVSNSQTLGLNRDPTNWSAIKRWERRLRKHLWWAILVTETWTAFGQGMPTHINMEDCDVPLPNRGELIEHVTGTDSERREKFTGQFYHLITLTMIVRDIMRTFYTVRAMNQMTMDLRLALNLVRPLRERLMKWNQDLPQFLRVGADGNTNREIPLGGWVMSGLVSSGSLRLAYLTAQVSLFRVLLRPLAMAGITAQTHPEQLSLWENDGAAAVIVGATQSTRELVRFVETLTNADWDSFWYSWSRHNFAVLSTFLMHLLVLIQPLQSSSVSGNILPHESPDHPDIRRPSTGSSSAGAPSPNANYTFIKEYTELQGLTRRWRWALRLAERGAGSRKGLISASLKRIEALFREWQTTEEG